MLFMHMTQWSNYQLLICNSKSPELFLEILDFIKMLNIYKFQSLEYIFLILRNIFVFQFFSFVRSVLFFMTSFQCWIIITLLIILSFTVYSDGSFQRRFKHCYDACLQLLLRSSKFCSS